MLAALSFENNKNAQNMKSFKFICLFFLFFFFSSHKYVKGFALKCTVLKTDLSKTGKYSVYRHVSAFFQPGNFTDYGSEVVKSIKACAVQKQKQAY